MSIAFNPILINQDTDEDFDESDALELFPTHSQVQTLYLTKTNPVVSGSIQATNFKSANSTLSNPSLHHTTHNNGIHLDATGVHLEQGNVSLLIAKPSEVEVTTAIRSTGSNQATNFRSTTSTLTNPSLHNTTHNNGVHLDATGVHLEQGDVSLLIAKPSEVEVRTKLFVNNASSTPADGGVGGLEGAIYAAGGINSNHNVRGQKFYTSVSSNAAPGFSFSSQTNLGINRTASNVISMVSNGSPQFSVGATGAFLPGRLGVGMNVIPGFDSLYVNSTGVADTIATSAVFLSATSLVDNRVLISSFQRDAYLLVENSLNSYSLGVKTNGDFAISPSLNRPTSAVNALTINPSGLVTCNNLTAPTISSTNITSTNSTITNLTVTNLTAPSFSPTSFTTQNLTTQTLSLNNMAFQNRYRIGQTSAYGTGGLVVSGLVDIRYQLVRVGRVVTIELTSLNFTASSAGNTLEISLDNMLQTTGLTVNSLPRSDGTYSGGFHFLGSIPVIRSNGGFEQATIFAIGLTSTLENARLRITALGNFSGVGNWILGGSVSYIARSEAL